MRSLVSDSPRPLRVLMVGHAWFDDNPGGGGRYLADVATGLVARGHTVCVLVPKLMPEAPDEEMVAGVRVCRFTVPAAVPRKIAAFARAAGALAAQYGSFDVLHSHFALNGVGPLWHPAFATSRRITQFQGPWAEEARVEGAGALSTFAMRLIERATYRRCHALITLSEVFKTLLARDYGVPPERIVAIPSGVDLKRFSPALERPTGVPTVFVIRRLVRRMGLEVLLDAWKDVHARHPEARLHIAGAGPLRAKLERRAGAGVEFLGRISEEALVEAYRTADLTIVPTTSLEGFGLVTVESLGCGTPVIGTTAGATPEILTDLDPHLLVAPGDAAALAERVNRFLDAPHTFPSRQQCRDYALAHYAWPAVLARLETVLQGG